MRAARDQVQRLLASFGQVDLEHEQVGPVLLQERQRRFRRGRSADEVDVDAAQQRRQRHVTQRVRVHHHRCASRSAEFMVHAFFLHSRLPNWTCASLHTTPRRPDIFRTVTNGVARGLSGSGGWRSGDHAVCDRRRQTETSKLERPRHAQRHSSEREDPRRGSGAGHAAEAVLQRAQSDAAEREDRPDLRDRALLCSLRFRGRRCLRPVRCGLSGASVDGRPHLRAGRSGVGENAAGGGRSADDQPAPLRQRHEPDAAGCKPGGRRCGS